MKVYYNEIDPDVCLWLKQLIEDKLIPDGDIDTRSIKEVTGNDIKSYKHCHFFSGIAGWALALNIANWPIDREVWTGSCPCQPYSIAGQKKGNEDGRNLWPEMHRLIKERKPSVVIGEQVASKDGRLWLSGVFSDLEVLAYNRAGADLCGASIGSPHIRQRLYWLAHSQYNGCNTSKEATTIQDCNQSNRRVHRRGSCGMDDSIEQGLEGYAGDGSVVDKQRRISQDEIGSITKTSVWSDFGTVYCRDGRRRRIKSGLAPVVNGVSERMVSINNQDTKIDEDYSLVANKIRIKAYGNAIIPQLASVFIESCMEIIGIK